MRFLTLLCCFFVAAASMAKDMKIGTVDLTKLFKEYPGTKNAQKKFNAMATKKQQDLADSLDEIKDLEKELKSSSSVLSTKQRKAKEKEYKEKAQAFQQQQNQITTDLQGKEQEMTSKLLDEIKAIVATVAKNQGVDLVLDAEKTVYAKDSVDLTAEVMKNYPKSDPSSDKDDKKDDK
jgi:Skp family chaperone for outer membrane proteins